ncbi:MAG: hypothetical protein JO256_12425 [Alphaproteobacteria bacterium]|nr:hypothetical protein [Alphaproteobacteria bacterium]
MRYYFDIQSERLNSVDHEGCELADDQQMRRETARLLAQIAFDELPYAQYPALSARVRDAEGRTVYCAVLRLEGARLQ